MYSASSNRRFWPILLVTVLIWCAAAAVVLQRQAILDWWRLRGYEPPTEIVALADATTMNDEGRRLFYTQHPDLASRLVFNEHCRDGEFTIVLGCYINNYGIYIYAVDDQRLQGIEEVTAAHEMLHAAYDRLSTDERKQVDAMLNDAFDKLENERIKKTVAQYEESDPASVPSELHSILGTEVRNLPSELEAYYKKYFEDRNQVVTLSEAYEAAFSERKAKIERYETRLKSLQVQIKAANRELKSTSESLARERQRLESSRNNTSPSEFNTRARNYNASVEAYNQRVAEVSSLIDSYNATYESYSKIVLEQQDLFEAIDSRPEEL